MITDYWYYSENVLKNWKYLFYAYVLAFMLEPGIHQTVLSTQ